MPHAEIAQGEARLSGCLKRLHSEAVHSIVYNIAYGSFSTNKNSHKAKIVGVLRKKPSLEGTLVALQVTNDIVTEKPLDFPVTSTNDLSPGTSFLRPGMLQEQSSQQSLRSPPGKCFESLATRKSPLRSCRQKRCFLT
jgi:hypothetical protein